MNYGNPLHPRETPPPAAASDPAQFDAPSVCERFLRRAGECFEPPGRALILWIILSGVSFEAAARASAPLIRLMRSLALSFVASTGALVPSQMPRISTSALLMLGLTWFMPMALRLPAWRGLLWLVSFQVCAVVFGTLNPSDSASYFLLGVLPIAHWLLLRGLRTPTFMAIAAGATGWLAFLGFRWMTGSLPNSVAWSLLNGLYAAILLYGTDPVHSSLPRR